MERHSKDEDQMLKDLKAKLNQLKAEAASFGGTQGKSRPDTPNLRIIAPLPYLADHHSLQRQFSDASTSSTSHENTASPPTIPSMTQHPLTSSPSSASLRSNGHAPTAATQPEATSSASHSDVPSSPKIRLNGQERPSTPPRKPYHIVNASPHLTGTPSNNDAHLHIGSLTGIKLQNRTAALPSFATSEFGSFTAPLPTKRWWWSRLVVMEL
ncbi:hypothetical protein APHAL10511_001462 [Amanita phalloides]|nr:hypothetical protein APHAL10511_001462 [Amanita phalloides]